MFEILRREGFMIEFARFETMFAAVLWLIGPFLIGIMPRLTAATESTPSFRDHFSLNPHHRVLFRAIVLSGPVSLVTSASLETCLFPLQPCCVRPVWCS